jgi:hypothetical protein
MRLPSVPPRVVALVAMLTTAPAAAQISVGPNVQVSRSRAQTPHFELLAAADPTNPDHLMGCSIIYPKLAIRGATIVYASFDGGKTWDVTIDEQALAGTGDPICTYGLDNVAYYVVLSLSDQRLNRKTSNTLIYRSTDGGRTWGPHDSTTFVDREFALVDNTSSKYRGTLYINGTWSLGAMQGSRSTTAMGLIRSRDGKHFEGPAARLAIGRRWILGMGNSVVLSDGSLVLVTDVIPNYFSDDGDNATGAIPAPLPGRANGTLEVVTATNGGETISASTKVADLWQASPYTATSINPYLAIDATNGPFKDRVYCVWPDQRSGRTEIYVSYSSDKAKTWSPPQLINDDRPPPDPTQGPDHLMPVIAVNKNGVVGIVWYDRRDNPDKLGYWVRFTASLDGGDTWLPSKRVSEAPSSFEAIDRAALGYSARGGGTPTGAAPDAPPPPARSGGNPLTLSAAINGFSYQGGHYSGMAADAAGAFRPMWVDNRTGVAQIWTAPVSVAGVAAKNGGGELASLDDVSSKVALDLADTRFDRGSGTVTFEARLKNTSKDTVKAPVKARVVTLQSQVGIPAVANADNRVTGVGAVFDFTPMLRNGTLLPNDSTPAKAITVRLSDIRLPVAGKRMNSGLVTIGTRVLATPKPEAAKPVDKGGG